MDPYQFILQRAMDEPEKIAAKVKSALQGKIQFSNAIVDILSFMPEKDLPLVVAESIAALKTADNREAVETIIAHCNLQSPKSLHPYLDELFMVSTN